jgi:hypothetical protein
MSSGLDLTMRIKFATVRNRLGNPFDSVTAPPGAAD